MIDHTIEHAKRQGVLDHQGHELAAIDSTGLTLHRRSTYFAKRSGLRYKRFAKLSAVTDVKSHLCLSLTVERGPKPDDPAMYRTITAALRRHRFHLLLADAGYYAEHHLVWLLRRKVLGIIPPQRGRPANGEPGGPWRRLLHRIWPHLLVTYGQRWQVETTFSMLKRRLGSVVRARKRHAVDRECHLKAIVLNLLILVEAGGSG